MEKWIFFLRALFPSWRFFVDAGPSLTLEVRVGDRAWEPCLPEIPRSLKTLLLNPEGNLLHACHNNLLHLMADIAHPSFTSTQDPEQLCSYRLTHNTVRFYLERQKKYPPKAPYQFRLQRSQTETVLESPLYEP